MTDGLLALPVPALLPVILSSSLSLFAQDAVPADPSGQQNPSRQPAPANRPAPADRTGQPSKTGPPEPADHKPSGTPTPFADRVVVFQRGSGGGNGEDRLPEIVLGPPRGGGRLKAGRHVLSLGEGGSITLEFVDNEVIDGPGPDFIIFENPFLAEPGNDPDFGFFELAKVEVSFDGRVWTGFPYDTASRQGCAGHRPVLAHAEKNRLDPTDPEVAGGDPFDLKTIGVPVVRFVRITDVQSFGGRDGAAGFDLDAIAAVHSRARPAGQQRSSDRRPPEKQSGQPAEKPADRPFRTSGGESASE